MISCNLIGRTRRIVIAAAILSSIGLMMVPKVTDAGGGVSPGAAVGIGLGAFALGTMAGAAPYYGAPYAPYGYYAAPAYYYPPPPRAYYPYAPRSCWDPYYRRYYAC